jgi:hypothetical protein
MQSGTALLSQSQMEPIKTQLEQPVGFWNQRMVLACHNFATTSMLWMAKFTLLEALNPQLIISSIPTNTVLQTSLLMTS